MEETQLTEMKPKKRILDIPVLGSFLLTLYGEALYILIGLGLGFLITDVLYYYIYTAIGVLLLVIHCLWFRKEFHWKLYPESLKDRMFWILLLIPFLIDIGVKVSHIFINGFSEFSAEYLGDSLKQTIWEEVIFRFMLLSLMMRRYKDKDNFLPVLILSSVLCGLSQYLSLNDMESFLPVTMSALFYICWGFLLGAIYLRTGNLFLTLVWHGLHLILMDFSISFSTESSLIPGIATPTLIEGIVLSILYVGFGLLLIKGQKEKIQKVWNYRWSILK